MFLQMCVSNEISPFSRNDIVGAGRGVWECGRKAPTFPYPIHSPGLCHFDAAPAAGEIYCIESDYFIASP